MIGSPVESLARDIKNLTPRWCAGCQRKLAPGEPHDDNCTIQIKKAAREASARQRGAVPMRVMLLLYGLVAVFAVVTFVIFRMVM